MAKKSPWKMIKHISVRISVKELEGEGYFAVTFDVKKHPNLHVKNSFLVGVGCFSLDAVLV